MVKLFFVIGTRPEAIKVCPIIKSLQNNPHFGVTVCLSGQHREMLNSVLEVFEVEPKYNLDIMKKEQTLTSMTVCILQRIDAILADEKPDLVLVHGDTTTSYTAALAAFNRHIQVAHIEAGLRTFNLHSPFPEEFNRRSIDLVSDIYFAPTENSKKNLLKEGISASKIFVTGNTVIDALSSTVTDSFSHDALDWCGDNRIILMTAHRRENIGSPMKAMFTAIRKLADDYTDVRIIYPIHLNPKVREIAVPILSGHDRIRLIEPLDVIEFHNIMSRCFMILTDSGGIQEEAPALGKPVLVMRDTTERPEGVRAGTLKLVGTSTDNIYDKAKELLDNSVQYEKMSKAENPYGDGHASERIINAIAKIFGV